MTSKLEAALANDLHLMSKREQSPWPEAVREMHPLWCCECPKVVHGVHPAHYADPGPICHGCRLRTTKHEGIVFGHAYAHGRDFRVDFAYPSFHVAIEVDGVVYGGQVGRHQTAVGFARDRDKDAALRLAGWDIIHVTGAQVKDGTALKLIEQALGVE